jgi:hypothetical protein
MDFHLSLSSIIIILFLSFLLTILPPSFCEEDDPFVVCNSTYACGGVNISFPFWGGNRPAYCGHPGHELRCDDNKYLVLGFEGLNFSVLNIDTSSPTFTIARSDLLADRCAPKYLDTTLNYTLFDYALADQNLTILYGCPDVEDYNIPALRNRFNCSRGEPDEKFNAYYLEDESPPLGDELYKQLTTICDNHTQVPILWSSASADLRNAHQAVEKAIYEGFEVEYSSELAIHCRGCKDSGGVCGSNSTVAFVCYCRNQVEPHFCPKPGKQALFSSLLSVSWIRIFAGYSSCFLISLSYKPITHRPPPQSGMINIFLIWQPEQLINYE